MIVMTDKQPKKIKNNQLFVWKHLENAVISRRIYLKHANINRWDRLLKAVIKILPDIKLKLAILLINYYGYTIIIYLNQVEAILSIRIFMKSHLKFQKPQAAGIVNSSYY